MPLPQTLPQAAKRPLLAFPLIDQALALVGPTASGKTALALELARRLGAELISADSRQLYRRLDAGTDKPRGVWRGEAYLVEGIPYHLVDCFDPAEAVDAGRYGREAQDRLRQIRARGRVPILVGGTGLYVKAALGGLDRLPRRDEAVRERLAQQVESLGPQWLHDELARVDPLAARAIAPGNVQRVVRAMEVYALTGRPISSFWSRPTGVPALYLGISWPKAELEERIRARCEAMFPAMVEETRRLVPAEYRGDEPGFSSLGYPEALACARGELQAQEALQRFVRASRQYAKRQATWFRRQAPVRWLASAQGDPAAWAEQAEALLRQP